MLLNQVNEQRTISNDINEVHQVLGLRCAREVLVREVTDILRQEGYIHSCHIELLADFMMCTGAIHPATRHGLNRAGATVIKRASFEEPTEVIAEAALMGSNESFCSITQAITSGQKARIGSHGLTELVSTISEVVPLKTVRTIRAFCPSSPRVRKFQPRSPLQSEDETPPRKRRRIF